MNDYSLTILGTLAALVVYIWATMSVGRARGRFKVDAPAVSGHPDFERVFRAQQNTLEALATFLPLVWITALLFGDLWGGIFAAVWVAGRLLYIVGYHRQAGKRGPGFLIAGVATLAALIACVIGAVGTLLT